MNILAPFSSQPLPRRSARVRSRATSEPAPGSVTPIAVTVSPAMMAGMSRAFCSGVP